jgi:hypothetical protein
MNSYLVRNQQSFWLDRQTVTVPDLDLAVGESRITRGTSGKKRISECECECECE